MKTNFLAIILFIAMSASSLVAGGPMTVKAVNKLSLSRASQTIELTAKDLAPLGEKDLNRIHVKDTSGKDLLCQAVDTDGDYTPDQVIFQSDFAANESKTFNVYVGNKWVYTKDQFKASGRFVRERFDDFCWENDRIAHRMYGKALETWIREPLTSSTVDIWSKRTARMVINDWYMVDNYHVDIGDGADFYSAGPSRGCGGNGLWAKDRLWVSNNFVNSRVLANGPIRVMFELTYEPFGVNGVSVSEVKRISLDAGQNLDRFQSTYKPAKPLEMTMAIGLKKVAGESKDFNAERGWLVKWERMEKKAGEQGLAVIVDPKLLIKQTEDQRNLLMLAKVPADNIASYWAGFCWDKAGHYGDEQAWKIYVDNFAQGLLSPIEVSVSAQSMAPTQELSDWPDGTSPAEVGKRVAENFVVRKFDYETNPKRKYVIYPEVCAWYGSLTVAQLVKDEELTKRLIRKFDPLLTPEGAKRISPDAHVDYRVFGTVPLEIYLQTKDKQYLQIGQGLADKQWDNATDDGITREARYWIDDMFMIPAVQTQAFRATNDAKYLDRTALTMVAYLDKLQQPNGLFFHGPDSPFYWSRGNGWMAAGMAELLRSMPEDHPKRARIMEGYKKMMAALLATQDSDGMWHQLIDKPDLWPETSGTGMFAYAMVTGVKNGWLDANTYAPAARKAWIGLVKHLDKEANIKDVCVGTNKGFSLEYYRNRDRRTGDLHGQAPLLWTAAALLR